VALGLAVPAANGQPSGSEPTVQREAVPAPVRDRIDPSRLKARLEERRDQLAAAATAVENAIQRLENGSPPEEVAADMERLADEVRGGDARDTRRFPGRDGGRRSGELRESRNSQAPVDHAATLEILKEVAPAFAARVESVRASNPEAADRMMGRMAPRLREAARTRTTDPELYELRVAEIRSGIDVLEAGRAYREAVGTGDAGAISGALAAVKGAAENQFDARLATERRELLAFEARVEEIRGQLTRRTSEREAMVNAFVERMTAEGGERGHRKSPL